MTAQAQQEHQCVPREEINASFREMNVKLDQILSGRIEEARAHATLQEQVRQLAATQKAQCGEIAAIRAKQNEPRDALMRFLVDVVKLILAAAFGALVAGIGYMMKKGGL